LVRFLELRLHRQVDNRRLEDGLPDWVQQNGCDLVAMSTHGHQLIADLVLGTTAIRVQHSLSVPVLLLRAK
jgi:nucleotide-binding universal stress UspA family protein